MSWYGVAQKGSLRDGRVSKVDRRDGGEFRLGRRYVAARRGKRRFVTCSVRCQRERAFRTAAGRRGPSATCIADAGGERKQVCYLRGSGDGRGRRRVLVNEG